MVSYVLAATVLKLFSVNCATQTAYRRIGNLVGQRMRKDQDLGTYSERGDLLVSLGKRYGFLHDGNCFLELGTGWVHWYAIYARLHAALHVDCFDVWDNRQLDALTNAFGNLQVQWERQGRITPCQADLLQQISDVKSFDELYGLLDMRYTIDADGALSSYEDDHYDCVCSFHVLEHVHRASMDRTIADMYRVLKKGGYSIHQIGIDDHLAHYDKRESPKHYLRYSHGTWQRFFENSVQHINTLQGTDFLDIFDGAGFESVEVDRERCDIDQVPIHADWQGYPREDLETTIMTIVHRKLD